MTIIKIISVFCFSICLSASLYADVVYVNKPESSTDKRYDYPKKLLQKILNLTRDQYGDADVQHSPYRMNRERLLLSLVEGELIHVVAEAPKKDWLKDLLVVRIPIRKGIQGYRLFFINKSDQPLFSRIANFEGFKQLPTGSGVGWSTAEIKRQAGFNVITGNNYEGLFDMLKRRRFLSLCRGINEIGPEFEQQRIKHPNLAIESKFALHIPLPTYFFVTPKRPDLKERIETGLNLMLENGSFDQFFLEHHQEIIENFQLKTRTVFSIPNPNLSDEDTLENPDLWYSF